jgi:hypothetical protein
MAGMFRKLRTDLVAAGGNRVLLTLLFFTRKVRETMSLQAHPTANPQLSTHIIKPVGGVMRFDEGKNSADWEATSARRDMHVLTECFPILEAVPLCYCAMSKRHLMFNKVTTG